MGGACGMHDGEEKTTLDEESSETLPKIKLLTYKATRNFKFKEIAERKF